MTTTAKRKRGEGGLYQQPPSKNWHISYYLADGTRRKESTHTENETEARRILRSRLTAIDRGEVPDSGKVKVSDRERYVNRRIC